MRCNFFTAYISLEKEKFEEKLRCEPAAIPRKQASFLLAAESFKMQLSFLQLCFWLPDPQGVMQHQGKRTSKKGLKSGLYFLEVRHKPDIAPMSCRQAARLQRRLETQKKRLFSSSDGCRRDLIPPYFVKIRVKNKQIKGVNCIKLGLC